MQNQGHAVFPKFSLPWPGRRGGSLHRRTPHAQRRAANPPPTHMCTNNVGIATVPPVRCSVWLGAFCGLLWLMNNAQ